MSLLALSGTNSVSGGYDIDNSLKFERANSEQIYTSNAAAGNRKTWTFSAWIKRTQLSQDYSTIFSCGYSNIQIMANDRPRLILYNGSSEVYADPEMLLRDTAAWYHIVVQVDSTQSTAADRVKWWINGNRITDFNNSTYTNMSQNEDFDFGQAGSGSDNYLRLGEFFGGSEGFSGYMADVYYLNGTAAQASDFGEYDDDSGIWIPKAYTGSGYGTQGFKYEFKDSSALGTDTSGEGHNANNLSNITSADQATDTPTNNFTTWLSDGTFFNGTNDSVTTKEGGTVIKRNVNTQWITAHATQAVNNGKWYYEAKVIAQKNCMIGAAPLDAIIGATNNAYYLGQSTDGTIGFQFSDGNLFYYTGYTNYVSGGLSTNDIVGFALDMDNNKCYVSVNGTYVNSADPANGTNGFSILDKEYIFATATYAPNQEYPFNMGGYTTISISSAASDENGRGVFEYAPPSGYYALCTKNLAEYG